MAQTTFRFGEFEAILADINGIPSSQRTNFASRLKDISGRGLLRMDALPRGKAASYGLRELALMAIAVEMCQLGLSTKRAVQVMLEDEFPLWMAVMMAADAIRARPEVFNAGPGDAGNPDDQEMWGFSHDWNDNESTDPMSMFLYFDPSVLAPWEQDVDVASATFFYAGAGIVRESISRWTTGPSRRIAMINVTKLIFDLAAYVGGSVDGLTICDGFSAAAEAVVHRGDFDLDEWLAGIAKAMGGMVAAQPEQRQPWTSLTDLVAAQGPLSRYLKPRIGSDAGSHEKAMTMQLPGQRELIVDEGVMPLADQPHRAIEARLEELAVNPYRTRFSDRTKYLLLYVPDDTFFANAMSLDHTIFNRALDQKVVVVTPSTLPKIMRAVDQAWDNYRAEFPDLAEDNQEIMEAE